MKGIIVSIRTDYRRYTATGSKSFVRTFFFNFGFIATAIFRFHQCLYYSTSSGFLRKLINISGFLGLKFSQLLYGITIPHNTRIGRGLFLSHNGPIIINSQCVIGENCNIGPMVVIGTGKYRGVVGCPVIGNRVWIGPGVKIFGPVNIGDEAVLGANAVISTDVPPRAVVVTPAPSILNYNSSESKIAL